MSTRAFGYATLFGRVQYVMRDFGSLCHRANRIKEAKTHQEKQREQINTRTHHTYMQSRLICFHPIHFARAACGAVRSARGGMRGNVRPRDIIEISKIIIMGLSGFDSLYARVRSSLRTQRTHALIWRRTSAYNHDRRARAHLISEVLGSCTSRFCVQQQRITPKKSETAKKRDAL